MGISETYKYTNNDFFQLPLDYTWQIVHDRVQKFGDLENVEIVSPGVAKVRFLRIPDAQRTKDTLSGTTVEGRVIAVEYL